MTIQENGLKVWNLVKTDSNVQMGIGLLITMAVVIGSVSKDIKPPSEVQNVIGQTAIPIAPAETEPVPVSQEEQEAILITEASRSMEESNNVLRSTNFDLLRNKIISRAYEWRAYARRYAAENNITPQEALMAIPLTQYSDIDQVIREVEGKELEDVQLELAAIQLAQQGFLSELGIDELPDESTFAGNQNPSMLRTALDAYRQDLNAFMAGSPSTREKVMQDIRSQEAPQQ